MRISMHETAATSQGSSRPARLVILTALALLLLLTLTVPASASQSAEETSSTVASARSCPDGRTRRAPVGASPCEGVRPGSAIYQIRADVRVGACTLNFLFKGSDGGRYMGTAGHCFLDATRDPFAERKWDAGEGPRVFDSGGRLIGRYVYAVQDENEGNFVGGKRDFALIRLDRGVKAKATMCFFGGPTGINSEITSDTVLLHFYGNGLGIGNAQAVDQPILPARSAIAKGMPDPNLVHAVGTVIPGDSGAGVISSDGRAVGVIATTGLNSEPSTTAGDGSHSGLIGITRLAPQMASAGEFLGISLSLITGPLAE